MFASIYGTLVPNSVLLHLLLKPSIHLVHLELIKSGCHFFQLNLSHIILHLFAVLWVTEETTLVPTMVVHYGNMHSVARDTEKGNTQSMLWSQTRPFQLCNVLWTFIVGVKLPNCQSIPHAGALFDIVPFMILHVQRNAAVNAVEQWWMFVLLPCKLMTLCLLLTTPASIIPFMDGDMWRSIWCPLPLHWLGYLPFY